MRSGLRLPGGTHRRRGETRRDQRGPDHRRLLPSGEHVYEILEGRPRRSVPVRVEGGGRTMVDTEPIQVVHPCCCGVDVHKRVVQACVLRTTPTGQVEQLQRSWSTVSADLLALADWLARLGCTHVAMESTGVYWKPLFTLLEGQFTVWVVNAQHIKQVPGRKTDVSDAAWIAGLLRHGLVRPKFHPRPGAAGAA